MKQPVQINTLFQGFAWALSVALLGCEPWKMPKKDLPPRTEPTVTTLPPTNVTPTSATLSLTLSSTGNALINRWGVCYSTSNQEPTINDSVIEGQGALITNNPTQLLMPSNAVMEGTTYYVQAFAVNTSGKPAYGGVQQIRVPITTGLIAHYPFQGNTKDQVAPPQDGILRYGASLGPDPKNNAAQGCLSLDGTSGYLEIPDTLKLRPSSITISLCIRPENPLANPMQIFYKGSFVGSTGEQYSSKMYRVGNSIRINVDIKQNSICKAGQWQTLSYDSNLALDTWHHLALVYDGDNSKLYMYLDGTLRAEATTNAKSIDNCPGGDLRFGAQVQDFRDYFKGQIDDIRIYKRPLIAKEIKFLSEEKP